MTNMINPSEVDTDTDVSADLFGETDGDYNSEVWEMPPKLWVQPQRVIPLGADRIEFQSIVIPSTGSGRTAVQVVPARGNNERKRVTISPMAATSNIVLLSHEETPMVSTFGAVNVVGTGFAPWVADNAPFVYEGAGGIWAILVDPSATAIGVLTLATETYFPETR